jgi:hypothetical protein
VRPSASVEYYTHEPTRVYTGKRDEPVILLSHIPLWRPDGLSCGALRERGAIRPGVGFGYQTMLGKETTTFLLNAIRPVAVFR